MSTVPQASLGPARLMCQDEGLLACRKQARREAATARGNPHGGSAAKKGRRAAVFAQWLVDTYGQGLLADGSGAFATLFLMYSAQPSSPPPMSAAPLILACGAGVEQVLVADLSVPMHAGVIDVAGGRGALSFALHALHGVPCTVIDPRSVLSFELPAPHAQPCRSP